MLAAKRSRHLNDEEDDISKFMKLVEQDNETYDEYQSVREKNKIYSENMLGKLAVKRVQIEDAKVVNDATSGEDELRDVEPDDPLESNRKKKSVGSSR